MAELRIVTPEHHPDVDPAAPAADAVTRALDRWGPPAEMLRWWHERDAAEPACPGAALVAADGRVVALAGNRVAEMPLLVGADDAESARRLGDAWPLGGDGLAAPIGAVGVDDAAWSFAGAVTRRSSPPHRVEVERAFRLHAAPVAPPPACAVVGRARDAGEHDHEIVGAWLDAFLAELALPPSPAARDERGRVTAIDQGRVRLWEAEGVPVACAMTTRPTSRSVAIGFVYAPPERRRAGHARAVVADVTTTIVASGRRPVLFTDRDAVGPERLYASLGYAPVTDWIDLRWRPAGADVPAAASNEGVSPPTRDDDGTREG